MDVFIEQIVKRKKTGKNVVLTLLIILAALALSAGILVVTFFLSYIEISLIFILAFAYGAYYLISRQNLEYEYALTNGELDVDSIVARRKRKRVVSVACKDFENFGRYQPEKFANRTFSTRLMTGSDDNNPDLYFAEFRHETLGHVLLVMEPDERTLKAILPNLKRSVSKEIQS